MLEQSLGSKIEAVLFMSGSPVMMKKIIDLLGCSEEEASSAVASIRERLSSGTGGISLITVDGGFQLVTKPELAPIIRKMVKDEMAEELTPAALETLSLIAYIGPTTKSAIEYIRGVNSQYALRNLLLRGLVEKRGSKDDERVIVYNITLDALRYLGLSRISELPEYQDIKKELEVVREEESAEEKENHGE